MPKLPSGTVTFLFSDIEGSTRSWERDRKAMQQAVGRHLEILSSAVAEQNGVLFKTIGDGTQSAFATAAAGVEAALNAQNALQAEAWPDSAGEVRVRMALHVGEAEPVNGDYLAAPLNLLARILDAGHGGQILLSGTLAKLVEGSLPNGSHSKALGEFQLRGLIGSQEIHQLVHTDIPADFPPLRISDEPHHNLPTHPTPFLGREQDVKSIEALLLRPEVRLVTLTGVGGVGKTRLGLKVAADVLKSFRDGVFLVDLARQNESELVPSATASALGLREQRGQALVETLAAHLRDKQLLLVLDNFEHLLPAATLVAELLASAPGLKVLATSRARLGLQAEHEFQVETLPVPNPERLPPLDELALCDAVALFVARAQKLRSEFTLTEENAGTVAAICARVDGVPLAIELAAARIKIMEPQELLERLERRLPTLTGGARDLPERHRTLRNTVAWSHDLLSPAEKSLFRRLSVFVGGWTLDGAEAVGTAPPELDHDALEILASLIDQSLVDELRLPTSSLNDRRHVMLEIIREYASEQLAASGESEAIERAFEDFFTRKAEMAQKRMHSLEQRRWVEALESEHDNMRAALGRALARGDGLSALSLAERLAEFWLIRGHWREGRDWLERTLALAMSADRSQRAAAQSGLGKLWVQLGDFEAAERHFRESLDARRELGEATGESEVLSALAMIELNRVALAEARALGEKAHSVAQKADDLRGIATAQRILGMIVREEGQLDESLALLEQSMAIGTTLEDPAWTARVAFQLGITHWLAGNANQAQHFLESSYESLHELGDLFTLAVIASHRGHLVFDEGDIKQAKFFYADALRHFVSIGDAEGIGETIEWLAVVAAAEGNAISALRLFGATAAARDALRLPPRFESDELRATSGFGQATLAAGENAQRAIAQGRALSLEQARDEALELATNA